jgi:ABC-type lipoprotein export system ATPase subunit
MSGRHRAPDAAGDSENAGDRDDAIFDIEFDIPPSVPRTRTSTASAPVATGAIEGSGIEYRRAGRTILAGVTLTALPGRSVAVMGPSGSGKTSLLAVLAGLERPDAGTVTRDRAARVGLILQSYGLVGVLTAAENVEAPLQAGVLGRLSRTEIQQRSAAALAAVGLDEVADHLIEELSGGQQQRVAIARALAVDPAVVFADELTAELDHDWKNRVVTLVLDVARRGGIVVLATHDPELAERCDHVVRLADGQLAAAG